MNRRTPLDHAQVYRVYIADGRRGSAGRTAAVFGVSRQRIAQIVQEHEQRHPVAFAPRVRPEPAQQAYGHDNEPCRTAAAAFDADELRYIPPPGAYPPAQPRVRDSAPFLETLIMSPVLDPKVQARPEVQAFTFTTPLPTLQAQTQARRRLRPAESWLILCACMTAVTVLVGTQVLSLGAVMLVICLVMWSVRI